jgi:hypothetical protein
MNNQISKYEQTEFHLKGLERLGYEVKNLWRELEARRVREEEGEVPGDLARRYSVPTQCPPTEEHMVEGRPQVLKPEVMWVGHHYTLTPGQREWLRNFAGLTPTVTVTIGWLEVWKGTQHPKAFKMVSDVHVDPKHRRHVLTELVIRDAGRFFFEAGELDREREEAKVKEGKEKVQKVNKENEPSKEFLGFVAELLK